MTTDTLTIRTNNVPRPVLEPYELTAEEQFDFDYLDWAKLMTGNASASFFRYKGQVYDLGEFGYTGGLPADNPLRKWDGYISDTFFSGVVVRYTGAYLDEVIVGTFYA